MVNLLKNLPQGLMTIPLVVDGLNCHITGLWHGKMADFGWTFHGFSKKIKASALAVFLKE